MKTTYIIFIKLILIFSSTSFILAQSYPCGQPNSMIRTDVPKKPNYSNVEIRIYNQILYFGRDTAVNIKVKIIPVGTFFNKNKKYTPRSIAVIEHSIAGSEIIIPAQQQSTDTSLISGNWDFSGGNSFESQFSFGFGKYKFEFYRWEENEWLFSDYVYIDYNDLLISPLPNFATGSQIDLRLDYFSKDSITYQFDEHHIQDNDSSFFRFWHINIVNKELKIWDKFGTCVPMSSPNKGHMISDLSENGAFLNWPIDASLYNGNIGQENAGELSTNLEIQNNHYARINRGIPFSVNDSATLSLKHSDTYANNARLYVENNSVFTVWETAELEINKYGNVIIEDGGKMYMEDNSNIYFADHGEIIINAGGTLYNCGEAFAC